MAAEREGQSDGETAKSALEQAQTTAAQEQPGIVQDPYQQAVSELKDLSDLVLLGKDWLLEKVFVWETALQFGIVATAFLLAFLLARPLSPIASALIEGRIKDRLLIATCTALSDLLLPIFFSLIVWGALHAADTLGFPSGLLRVAGSLVNAWIVIRLVSVALRSPALSRVVAIAAWSVAALSILGLYEPTVSFLDSLAVQIGETRISLFLVIKGCVVAAILLWAAGAAARLVQQRVGRVSAFTPSVQVLISQVTKFTLILLAVLVAVNAIGIDLTAFAVFSGALGVGIGFGLQKIVSNIISGIILLTDRSIKPGDVIEVAGTYGVVETLGARYVSVVTRDKVEHLIPNEHLIVNTVVNWSYSSKNVRHRLPVGVSYETDVEKAIELCIEAALETPRVLKNPKPNCLLRGFGDSSVDLELRIWIQDPEGGVANVSSAVYLAVWKKFREHGIEIPFPQRDIHIKSVEGIEHLQTPATPLAKVEGS